jgi:RNA polymerase sigma-70 factor (ECF subfamily)
MTRFEFEALFRQNYSNLCSYAHNFLKDSETSEEIVQEVLVNLWKRRNSLEIRDSVKAYLFRAVRNSCMNYLKHLKVREQHASETRSAAPEGTTDPEQVLIVSELEERIRQAIDKLPIERKKAFCLSRYEGLTYPEIAERLDISVKTVENQIGSALKTLRKELAEYLPWLILFFFHIFRDR